MSTCPVCRQDDPNHYPGDSYCPVRTEPTDPDPAEVRRALEMARDGRKEAEGPYLSEVPTVALLRLEEAAEAWLREHG